MSDLTECQVGVSEGRDSYDFVMDGMGAEFAARLERKIWIRIWLANLVGVIPINIFLVLSADVFASRARFDLPSPLNVIPAVAVYLPAFVWTRVRARGLFAPIASWLAAGREPTSEERSATISHPRALAVMSFWAWAWAFCAAYAAALILFRPLGVQYIRMGVTVALSTGIACALTYLVAEDALRPLFSVVLRKGTSRSSSVGVMPRLTSAWFVGSGSYLVAIALTVGAVPRDLVGPWVIGGCLFGLFVGGLVTFVGARSVARPLESLRRGLERVEQGDFQTSVDVDDAGEVGRLQSGFNRMVSGLRDRDRLQRLFSRHVGDEVAQRAVAAATFGGTQLDVSVMFVDVIGSTTLAAERPPEAVVSMLNSLFAEVVRIVGEHGGLVNQFQGDGALCVFGAPVEMSDHAERALRATTALRARIETLGNTYPGFDAAIGVSSGRVVAGDVGTEDRSEYTVIGDAANEASRLVDEAKRREGRVLVSATTIISAGDAADGWMACDEVALRGRRQPTQVYEPEAL